MDTNAARVAASLKYAGIRNIRDDGSADSRTIQTWLRIYSDAGVRLSMIPINGDVARSVATYTRLAAEGALLAVEGPNEPNNFPVTYNGEKSDYRTSFVPVAKFQRDLSMTGAVKPGR